MHMYIEQDACIGIIHPDHKQIRYLRSSLLGAGFNKVQAETNSTEAIYFLERTDPDALILADNPIGISTVVISQVREFNDRLPIIVIGSVDDEDYVSKILDKGADDYLIKSEFQPRKKELPARVMSLLRRANLYGNTVQEPRVIRNGELTIDFAGHLVTKDGNEIYLTKTEYKLLATLARNVGRTLTHQDIVTRCLGSEWVTDDNHTLRVYVNRLRGKLEDSGMDSRFVVTKPGIGYSMPRLTNQAQ